MSSPAWGPLKLGPLNEAATILGITQEEARRYRRQVLALAYLEEMLAATYSEDKWGHETEARRLLAMAHDEENSLFGRR